MIIEKSKGKEDIQVVLDGINSYNESKVNRVLPESKNLIELIARNDFGEIIGGVIGNVSYYACFMIHILWIRDDQRKTGLGSKLLKEAENEAKQKGATIVVLDTFSFQAEQFYLKNNYVPFGKIDNFPEGHYWVHLKKKL